MGQSSGAGKGAVSASMGGSKKLLGKLETSKLALKVCLSILTN